MSFCGVGGLGVVVVSKSRSRVVEFEIGGSAYQGSRMRLRK